jgi:hypothetical protein
LAPPTYPAAPEVADYHAIALCEHVAGGDIGVFGTHICARVIHADVGPFPIFPIQMVISAGAGDRQHPIQMVISAGAGATGSILESGSYVRIVAIFAFFRYFSQLDQKNFSRFRRALSLISTVGFAIFTISPEGVQQAIRLIPVDTASARTFLHEFEQLQARHIAERERLLRELNEL